MSVLSLVTIIVIAFISGLLVGLPIAAAIFLEPDCTRTGHEWVTQCKKCGLAKKEES